MIGISRISTPATLCHIFTKMSYISIFDRCVLSVCGCAVVFTSDGCSYTRNESSEAQLRRASTRLMYTLQHPVGRTAMWHDTDAAAAAAAVAAAAAAAATHSSNDEAAGRRVA